MHVTSLPSDYGVGVFDENALKFADFLSDMNFSYWQVLPFNPIDYANSPYASSSAFAGNFLFIDPKDLYNMGLITKEELSSSIYKGSPYTADYDFAKKTRMDILNKAFLRIDSDLAAKIREFDKKNPNLSDFCYFMAIKEANNFSPWWEWPYEFSHYEIFLEKHKYDYNERVDFWKFCQYIFFKEWKNVKEYVNSKNIKIIGDMPIYVSLDSADVWANIDLFKIDKTTLKPSKVAGVPPDYFSEDGQLWGNPLYDWDKMSENGYKWWLDRIENSLRLYDVVRIDHFRAFASFWEVDALAKTAKFGKWQKGPGMEFFKEVFKKFPDAPIIAEDLGVFGDDVKKLLEDTKFPGMNVIQFGFDPDSDSTHLPHNASKNSVSYVGTHDNNTILGWLWESDDKKRRFALDYCGFAGDNWGEGGYKSESCRRVIEAVWRSPSNIAMIQFQDMCGFGADARMNTPGVALKNWRYRTVNETIDNVDKEYFKKINSVFKRI